MPPGVPTICGIPVEVLAEYVAKILDFCKERNVGVAMYAHASVGTIHIRPILDLKLQSDIEGSLQPLREQISNYYRYVNERELTIPDHYH